MRDYLIGVLAGLMLSLPVIGLAYYQGKKISAKKQQAVMQQLMKEFYDSGSFHDAMEQELKDDPIFGEKK